MHNDNMPHFYWHLALYVGYYILVGAASLFGFLYYRLVVNGQVGSIAHMRTQHNFDNIYCTRQFTVKNQYIGPCVAK